MKQLLRNHRTMGYELARTTTDDGQELVILRTGPSKQDVAPAHMLMPATIQEAAFDIRVGLATLIERARFFELDDETLETLLREEFAKS